MSSVAQSQLRYRNLWLLGGFIIMALVITTSLLPPKNLPKMGMSDKVEHALAYGLLAFWFGSIVLRRNLLWVAVGLLALGGAIEIVQGMMPYGRKGDWYDFLADGIGVVLGLLLALTALGGWVRWVESMLLRSIR